LPYLREASTKIERHRQAVKRKQWRIFKPAHRRLQLKVIDRREAKDKGRDREAAVGDEGEAMVI
jgi:hypothetical protein